MARTRVVLPTLTIPSGQTLSNEWNSSNIPRPVFGSLVDFLIYGPATLPETITVQVAAVDSPAAGDWRNLVVSGGGVTIAAGTATQVSAAGFKSLRLSSGAGVGADRIFTATGQVDV